MKSIIVATALMTSLTTLADQPSALYLTDNHGMTLYIYDKDQNGISTCNGQCATNWPPYLVSDQAYTKPGWSKIAREDGTWQWSFNNQPLYYWAGDRKPGYKKGDNIGGVWHVVYQKPSQSAASNDDKPKRSKRYGGYGY